LAINAKGGENIKPKAKRPHHHFKKFRNEDLIGFNKCLFFNWYSRQFQISIYFKKNLLKTKGRISFRGSFCLVKGKAFEIGGEISNLEKMLLTILFIYL
jgi:hypothetical protein